MDIKPFQFSFNPKLVFGAGSINELCGLIGDIGNNILIITGMSSFKSSPKREKLLQDLKNSQINYYEQEIEGEASPDFVDEIASFYRDKQLHAVLSIGGGSVIDTGKAVSAMIPQKESAMDYIEGLGKKKHNGIKVPFIAVPTTAGTGSEATNNAVLSRIGPQGFKKSLRHNNLIPDAVIIDPELTLSCPFGVTAASGMDAFTQLLESFMSVKASVLSDALSINGLEMFKNDALIAACTDGAGDISVRSRLSYAAYLSGAALTNVGLGAVHGLAGVIGGLFNIPHGTICASLVGRVTKYNIEKLLLENQSYYLKKYSRIGHLLTDSDEKDIKKGCDLLINKIEEWARKLTIPNVKELGISEIDLKKIAQSADSKSNPVKLNSDDFINILTKY